MSKMGALRGVGTAIALFLALGAARAHAEPTRRAAIRGITIGPIESSQQPGRGYGTEYTAALLDELVRLGANAVSITPFGRLWDLQSTEILLDFEAPFAENRAAVGRLVAQARARGLAVLIVPHLWIEVPNLWRGEIDPGTPEAWAAYQASYRRFLLTWAKAAEEFGADAFSIGVECKSWSGRFGSYWLQLIADVRQTFRGKLVYSANWDEAENVVFWDALDFVGINAFYPLAANDGASYAEYAAGAERALAGAGELARTVRKPLLFLEIGYTSRPNAAVKPWVWPEDMPGMQVDEFEQARALSALIGASVTEPWFAGFFVWRYYANLDDVSQEPGWGFSPHAKLAEQVLSNVFTTPWVADPDPARDWLELPSRPKTLLSR
jgi:glycosyl hydrolase family 113